MERESFIFYRSFYEAIEGLSEKVQFEVFKAVTEYGLHGTVTRQLSSIARSIFILIKPQIDANNKRYKNGLKGGAPKGSRNNPHGRPKTNQELTKNKPNDNVNENENVNENDNDNVNDNENDSLTVINASSSITKLTQERAFDFMDFFNSVMKRSNAQIPQIKTLSGEREVSLNARIREYGLDAVKEVIEKAAASNFLNGRGPTGWVADCTWILRPNNFPKILEGNFDNHPQQITCYYDKRQQNKQAIIAHQNAALDRMLEEECRRWEQERQQQLADGEEIEDVFDSIPTLNASLLDGK